MSNMPSGQTVSDTLAFVRLQQLISPSLPIGAFTYSQGMEWALECGWVNSADDVQEWLHGLMRDSLQWLELPLLLRLYRAVIADDVEAFAHYSDWAVAGRETLELRNEESQRARALLMVLNKLPDTETWPRYADWQTPMAKTALGSFAMACVQWQVSEQQTLNGYLWSWLENMVTVAVKLVPLGQSDGQRMLYTLSADIEGICQRVLSIDDDDIGASTMAMAIASSLHETQYCRLFRS